MSYEMAMAAALELTVWAEEHGLKEDTILPKMTDWEVVTRIGAATAVKAQESGLSRASHSRKESSIQQPTEFSNRGGR